MESNWIKKENFTEHPSDDDTISRGELGSLKDIDFVKTFHKSQQVTGSNDNRLATRNEGKLKTIKLRGTKNKLEQQ